MLTLAPYFVKKETDDEEIIRQKSLYLNWFLSTYPDSEFKQDELLYHHYLRYVDFFEGDIGEVTLNAFIKVELRDLVLKKGIRVTGASGLDYEDILQQTRGVELAKECLQIFIEVIQAKDIQIDDFIFTVGVWINNRLENALIDSCNEVMTILQSVQKKKAGPKDALSHMESRVIDIREMYSQDRLIELQNKKKTSGKFRFLCNTGIEPLDNVIGGIYSSELISIEAPPGIGKTKFALCQLMWRASVIFGISCAFFSLEQTLIELEALLIARHYYYLYKSILDEKNYRIQENFDALPDNIKRKIEVARDDLFSSGQYGKIYLSVDSLQEKTIIDKLKRVDKLQGGVDINFIDYIGLVEGDDKKYQKDYEVIKSVLMKAKAYGRNEDKATVVVNQLGSGGAELAAQGKAGSVSGAQGGMIVYRSSDKNIILSATQEMKVQQKRRLELTKSRGSIDVFEMILGTKLCMGAFFPEP